MARRTQTYAIRLAVEGGGQVKAELISVGQSGEQSLKRIETAGERASGGLKGRLNTSASTIRTRQGPSVSIPTTDGAEIEGVNNISAAFGANEPYTIALLLKGRSGGAWTKHLYRSNSASTGDHILFLSSGTTPNVRHRQRQQHGHDHVDHRHRERYHVVDPRGTWRPRTAFALPRRHTRGPRAALRPPTPA